MLFRLHIAVFTAFYNRRIFENFLVAVAHRRGYCQLDTIIMTFGGLKKHFPKLHQKKKQQSRNQVSIGEKNHL